MQGRGQVDLAQFSQWSATYTARNLAHCATQRIQTGNQQAHKQVSLHTILLPNCQRIASKAILYRGSNNRWFCGASGLPT